MREIGLLFLAVATVAGCGMQEGTERMDAQPLVQSSLEAPRQQSVTPRLWLDEDAAEMVRVTAGYSEPEDRVWVIRWEHGKLRGWAKFESREEPLPLLCNLGVPPDHPGAVGVDDASGWLVVAMRKLANTPGEAYNVRIDEQFTLHEGDSAQAYGVESRRGTLVRVPADISPEDDWNSRQLSSKGSSRFTLTKWQDGGAAPWLEVSVDSLLPSEPRSNVEP
jgi:hypothetical protein